MSTPTHQDSDIRINKFILKATHTCPTLGWKMARQGPEPPDLELLTLFKQGNIVEGEAIEQIGGGNRMPISLVDAVRCTREAIDSDSNVNIVQPAFEVAGVVIRPDVIDGDCREITEIKSSKKVKDDHILDLAISTSAAEHSDYTIETANLMHINPEHRVENTEPVMISHDVSEQVRAIADGYDLPLQIETIRSSTMPVTTLKKECKSCPFASECFEEPEALIINIPRLNAAKLQPMIDANVQTMDQLEADEDLYNTLTAKQKEAVEDFLNPEDGGIADITVDQELLTNYEWLDSQVLFHLDLETSTTAIPQRTGEKPWAQSVTQFSVTIDDGESLDEIGFLSDGSDDREQLVTAMIAAVEGDAPIVVYSASFEKGRIQELADALPHHSEELTAICDRMVDLLPVVRNCVSGLERDSLKSIGPIADSTFTYDDLQIQKGDMANAVMTLMRLEGGPEILHSKTGMDVDEARDALLAYCARDTLGTAVVVRFLKGFLTAQAPIE